MTRPHHPKPCRSSISKTSGPPSKSSAEVKVLAHQRRSYRPSPLLFDPPDSDQVNSLASKSADQHPTCPPLLKHRCSPSMLFLQLRDTNHSVSAQQLQELEKKCAYVRRDVYGTMGRGGLLVKEKVLLALAPVTLVSIRVVLATIALVLYYLICRICTLFFTTDRTKRSPSPSLKPTNRAKKITVSSIKTLTVFRNSLAASQSSPSPSLAQYAATYSVKLLSEHA